jgi:hypothetical protein
VNDYAYTIVTFLLLYLSFAIPFRLIGLPVIDLVRGLWAIFKYALVMTAVVVLVRIGGVWLDIAALPLLVTCVLTGGATYIILMLWNKPPVVRDVAALLPLHRIPMLHQVALSIGLVEQQGSRRNA